MPVAVDTNIIFDVLLADPNFLDTSKHLLASYIHQNLIICEAVYSELAIAFTEKSSLDNFLEDVHITLEPTTNRGLWIASRAWLAYSKRRKTNLQCSSCGHDQEYSCDVYGQVITSRQHVLADFMIAGHALEHEAKLITRDRGFYRNYFPELVILE